MKMTRREKVIWGLFAGILIILFLLSSTDLIIKEKDITVYSVSVILDDTTDDYYKNFRKGMDKAANEYNVDVNFVTLYEKGDVEEQMELLNRELSDGTQAVVFVPLKQAECRKLLDEMALTSPLIIMGNSTPGDWAMTGISQDYYAAGKLLGEAIIRDNNPDRPVFLFTEGLDYGYNEEVYNGLLDVISKVGFNAHHYEMVKSGMPNTPLIENEDYFKQVIEEEVYSYHGEAILVALDVKSLDLTADIMAGSADYGKNIATLYGFGSTTKILNDMDRGVIKGLVTTNQFDEGYLSIVKAVEAIEKSGDREQIILESYYLEKENLKEKYFEKILYPIE